ncbi:tRNA-dihydrouridine synthase family protein [Candidatus Woesearchaeota archaeon]|nr:tRNA-dihydrouridine synthase family protein [Candidatus Woesearchaeota archaeon]
MEFWLAPMEGVTDCAFRTLCCKYGADLTFAPMARVDSILRNRNEAKKIFDLNNSTPTAIQLMLIKLESAKEFVKNFESFNIKPKMIDINVGCPGPEIIKSGGGAALMKRVTRVQELVNELKKIGLPVSVKLRLGLSEYEAGKKTYLNLIKNVDADFFIVHARHAKQDSSDEPDWNVFEECVATGKRIVANGGIRTKEDLKLFEYLGMKEVMIGTAALKNPSVFRHLKGDDFEKMEKVKYDYLRLADEYDSKFKDDVLKIFEKAY